MILLLGGTSDSGPIATRLAAAGYRVLVSKATDVPLECGGHPNIEFRSGPLDDSSLAELIRERSVRAVVDATHPYAAGIRARARRVAAELGVPYLSYVRPTILDGREGVEFAPDHATAAAMAFAHGRPVLLTSGVRNLAVYADESRRTGVPLVVRTLDHAGSLAACREAGIPDDHVLAGRGPYTVDDNHQHIRQFTIGVLVTKDSGQAGGTLEKLEAAEAEHCAVIVVRRPALESDDSFGDIDQLVAAIQQLLPSPLAGEGSGVRGQS
jgi:precorrin-6A/cobalt-precorrin-6A reductase